MLKQETWDGGKDAKFCEKFTHLSQTYMVFLWYCTLLKGRKRTADFLVFDTLYKLFIACKDSVMMVKLSTFHGITFSESCMTKFYLMNIFIDTRVLSSTPSDGPSSIARLPWLEDHPSFPASSERIVQMTWYTSSDICSISTRRQR